MKKKKKAITIILIVFILVFGFIFGGYFVTKTVMTKGAINYLQDKYNMSYNQITVIDYEMKKPGNDTSFLPLNTYWSPYKWELEYNNKSFFVNRIDGKYYDDFQLTQIYNWSIEYLQKNIDNHISGIEIHYHIELMKEIAFHILIAYLVAEQFSSDTVAGKTDAFCSHNGQPSLSIFAE